MYHYKSAKINYKIILMKIKQYFIYKNDKICVFQNKNLINKQIFIII